MESERAFLEVHYVSGDRVEVSVDPVDAGWRVQVKAEDERYNDSFSTFRQANSAARERFQKSFPAHFCTPRCRKYVADESRLRESRSR